MSVTVRNKRARRIELGAFVFKENSAFGVNARKSDFALGILFSFGFVFTVFVILRIANARKSSVLKEELFFVGEVNLPDGDTPYTFEKKYGTRESPLKEGALSKKVQSTLRRYCRALVRLLDMGELCRIDFFLTKEGKIYFNEINTLPGFSEHSFYPEMCQRHGFDYKTLLISLCEAAYARHLR